RREEERGAVEGLTMRGEVAEEKRRAARRRLDRRQPEALGERGDHDGGRGAAEAGEYLVRDVAGEADAVAEPVRSDPCANRRRGGQVRIRLEVADEDEQRWLRPLGGEQGVGVDQRLGVLVRADPAPEEEEAFV